MDPWIEEYSFFFLLKMGIFQLAMLVYQKVNSFNKTPAEFRRLLILAEVPAALGSDAISAGSPDGQMALPKPTLAEMVITLQ